MALLHATTFILSCLVNPAGLPCRRQCKLHLTYKTYNTAYSHLGMGRETLMPLLHALFPWGSTDNTYFYIFFYYYYLFVYTHIYSVQTSQDHFAAIGSVSSKKAEHSSWASCGWGPAEAAAHGYLLAQAPAPGVEAEGALQTGSSGVAVPRSLIAHIVPWAGYLWSIHECHWTPQVVEWGELSDQQKLLAGPGALLSFTHSASSCTNRWQVRWGEKMNIMVNIMVKCCLNCHEKLRVISSPGL